LGSAASRSPRGDPKIVFFVALILFLIGLLFGAVRGADPYNLAGAARGRQIKEAPV